MRYAIYYTPEQNDPLTVAANAWLGRDAFDGRTIKISHAFARFVEEPARYGFHGTLKAPFRLKDGIEPDELADSFVAFCMESHGFILPELTIGRIGPFFALVPRTEVAQLESLGSSAVKRFEPFRAPLTQADIARRNPSRLTGRQHLYLGTWGYPYVFEEFRFHMTLTGPVPDEHAASVAQALTEHFADHVGKPHQVKSCALFVEREPGKPFQIDTFSRLAA